MCLAIPGKIIEIEKNNEHAKIVAMGQKEGRILHLLM